MTKSTLIKAYIMVSVLLGANLFVSGQCKAKEIVKKSKANITKPYKYDSYALSEIAFTDKDQKMEVQFTAFQGQKYRVLFLTSGFEEAVTLDIYDKSNRVKKGRNKVYDNSQGIDNNFWSFQPPKSGNYFIEYNIPPGLAANKSKKGCIVMVIGYIGAGEKEE
jgi:hypothetical protein